MSSKATGRLQYEQSTVLPPTMYGKRATTDRCNNKLKIAIVSALVLIAVVTIALASATIYFFASQSRHSSEDTSEISTLERKAGMMNELVRSRRSERASIQRRPSSGQSNRNKSCYSLMTNDSYPAAHITGIMPRWTEKNIPTADNLDTADAFGYKSHWVCMQTRGAFVEGGMYFNQTDKKLYVPKCGFYYVSSQMFFSYTTSETNKFVRHVLTVDRNCGGQNKLELESLSSLGDTGKQSKTSTYLADIVKICAGGTISVKVPATNEAREPCCPGGQNTITFFSAHLVKEAKCEWTNKWIFDHPPTQEEYDNYYNSTSS